MDNNTAETVIAFVVVIGWPVVMLLSTTLTGFSLLTGRR